MADQFSILSPANRLLSSLFLVPKSHIPTYSCRAVRRQVSTWSSALTILDIPFHCSYVLPFIKSVSIPNSLARPKGYRWELNSADRKSTSLITRYWWLQYSTQNFHRSHAGFLNSVREFQTSFRNVWLRVTRLNVNMPTGHVLHNNITGYICELASRYICLLVGVNRVGGRVVSRRLEEKRHHLHAFTR